MGGGGCGGCGGGGGGGEGEKGGGGEGGVISRVKMWLGQRLGTFASPQSALEIQFRFVSSHTHTHTLPT